jgi:hypothetical protein
VQRASAGKIEHMGDKQPSARGWVILAIALALFFIINTLRHAFR